MLKRRYLKPGEHNKGWKPRPWSPCRTCGVPVEWRRPDRPAYYCGRKCMPQPKRERKKPRKWPPFDCLRCGAHVPKRKAGHVNQGSKPKYCSRACSFAARASTTRHDTRPWCNICNPGHGSHYCGKQHHAEWRIARWMNGEQESKPAEAPKQREFTCKKCGGRGVKTGKGMLPSYCSDACRGPARTWKRQNDHGSHMRRAKHYGVEREHVNKLKVFKGAGWHCAQCRRATPPWFMGTNHPCAPELDHVVPLSKGGPHTYGNVQLLCRACNAVKADKLPPQVADGYTSVRTAKTRPLSHPRVAAEWNSARNEWVA